MRKKDLQQITTLADGKHCRPQHQSDRPTERKQIEKSTNKHRYSEREANTHREITKTTNRHRQIEDYKQTHGNRKNKRSDKNKVSEGHVEELRENQLVKFKN